jgi:hypothetical protein
MQTQQVRFLNRDMDEHSDPDPAANLDQANFTGIHSPICSMTDHFLATNNKDVVYVWPSSWNGSTKRLFTKYLISMWPPFYGKKKGEA